MEELRRPDNVGRGQVAVARRHGGNEMNKTKRLDWPYVSAIAEKDGF